MRGGSKLTQVQLLGDPHRFGDRANATAPATPLAAMPSVATPGLDIDNGHLRNASLLRVLAMKEVEPAARGRQLRPQGGPQ